MFREYVSKALASWDPPNLHSTSLDVLTYLEGRGIDMRRVAAVAPRVFDYLYAPPIITTANRRLTNWLLHFFE